MVGSAYRFFDTAEEYVHAVRAAEVQAAIARPGRFQGELARVDFDRLWLQRGTDSLPRSLHVSISPQRAPIFLLTDRNQAAIYESGVEFKPGQLLFWGHGSEQYQRTEGEVRWGAMSLAPDDLTRAAMAILGYEMTVPKDTLVLHPREAAMERLTGLHRVAGALAKSAPEIIAHPEVAHALEQALGHAMLTAIDSGAEAKVEKWPKSSRRILAGLEALIAENSGKPLYLIDLCVALGAPERTLRRAFQEQLGMSPNRYLWLRRMHLARNALRRASPSESSVTSIAIGYGFWELGRFATAYRKLFGESPSTTLRQPRDFVSRSPSSRGPGVAGTN